MKPSEAGLLLWEDVNWLRKGVKNVRTFLMPRGTASAGYSYRESLHLLESRFPGYRFFSRPTGGGIVFHGGDVCFGIVVPLPGVNLSRSRLYVLLGEVIADFVKKEFSLEGVEVRREVRVEGNFCAQMHAPGELAFRGKKFCGMAMRFVYGGIILQGTLAVEAHVTPGTTPYTTSLAEISGTPIKRKEVANLLEGWLRKYALNVF